MFRRLPLVLCVITALLSASRYSAAETSQYPPAIVTVVTPRTAVNPYPALVRFDIPIPFAGFPSTDSLYLVGEKAQLYACQVEPSNVSASGRTFNWFQIISLAPCRPQTLKLLPFETLVRPDVLLVSSLLIGDSLTLETNPVRVRLHPARFRVAEEVSLFGRPLLPSYDDDLVNRQQSVELVITDRYRRADFTLSPEISPGGFSLERRGPVIATALYTGRFLGPNVQPIPFEARVSLTAHSLLRVAVVIHAGAFDRRTFAVKELHLTLPCTLGAASSLDFGGFHGESLGPEYYSGRASLKVGLDGTYSLTDPNHMDLFGKGDIFWADYNNSMRGLALIFDHKTNALFIEADYNEDILDVRLTPPDATDDSPVTLETWLFFHPGRAGVRTLGHVSQGLFFPPAIEPSLDYVKCVTMFP